MIESFSLQWGVAKATPFFDRLFLESTSCFIPASVAKDCVDIEGAKKTSNHEKSNLFILHALNLYEYPITVV